MLTKAVHAVAEDLYEMVTAHSTEAVCGICSESADAPHEVGDADGRAVYTHKVKAGEELLFKE